MSERSIWQYLQTLDVPVAALVEPPEAVPVDRWFTPASEPIRVAYARAWPADCLWVEPASLKDVAADPSAWFDGGQYFRRLSPQVLPALYVETAGTMTRFYALARGQYRIFDEACYRLYWGATPPAEEDTPQATAASLPDTPGDTFADGTWYFSASWYNGIYDSGFLPVGPNGETYLTLVIVDGQVQEPAPAGPQQWQLEQRAGGVVRVVGFLYSTGDDQPDQWAIAYTTDGSTPPEDAATIAVALAQNSLAVLAYDLPAQADGTVVKVRLQTRRNDGTPITPSWTYSDDSTVKTLTVDTTGPTAPLGGDAWPGQIGETG